MDERSVRVCRSGGDEHPLPNDTERAELARLAERVATDGDLERDLARSDVERNARAEQCLEVGDPRGQDERDLVGVVGAGVVIRERRNERGRCERKPFGGGDRRQCEPGEMRRGIRRRPGSGGPERVTRQRERSRRRSSAPREALDRVAGRCAVRVENQEGTGEIDIRKKRVGVPATQPRGIRAARDVRLELRRIGALALLHADPKRRPRSVEHGRAARRKLRVERRDRDPFRRPMHQSLFERRPPELLVDLRSPLLERRKVHRDPRHMLRRYCPPT